VFCRFRVGPKTLEDFDFTFQRSVKKQVIEHLGQLDFLHERANIVAFRTATEWVALLADAQRQGRLDDELRRLERYPLLIVQHWLRDHCPPWMALEV
jgi:DNA replication protein DnaC